MFQPCQWGRNQTTIPQLQLHKIYLWWRQRGARALQHGTLFRYGLLAICHICKSMRQKADFSCVLSVNGGWSAWTPWSQCSSECDSGVQTRERFCNSPSPQHGGSSCPGPQIQTKDCNSHPCSGAAWCLLIMYTSSVMWVYVCMYKSYFLSCSSQVNVQRAWCTWQQLSVKLTAVRVRGCVWTWRPQMCSVRPPVMTAATVPWDSTCSTAAVCP